MPDTHPHSRNRSYCTGGNTHYSGRSRCDSNPGNNFRTYEDPRSNDSPAHFGSNARTYANSGSYPGSSNTGTHCHGYARSDCDPGSANSGG